MATKIEKDAVTGRDTTGHEWDGIKELNTPLPSWWLYVFYATILWSFAYFVLYPAWPSLSGHTDGILGYNQRVELSERLAAETARRAPIVERIRGATLDQIRANPELAGFAFAGGRAAFADNCAPCHGAGGAGAKGFPSLADDDWLWGGDIAAIHQTIADGVRNANDKSRNSLMPRFGADGVLTPAQIGDVAEFVLSLSGHGEDRAAAARGAPLYADNCVACHGEKGEGNQELGAPRLNDQIWLYGGTKTAVVQSIHAARAGTMPAWSERLDDATIKMLAIYVHALGGGK
ncbi:MAG: cytochrome-c oxidase, cbb3-type subunit III [Proteobacteria bacterium]|nr:cytochrome-c oxidase, cbb3-type subunit III [Pseudomonadota bacterium]